MVKSTYVLDVETAETLDRLAKDWNVSKSEVLRRAVRAAGATTAPDRMAHFRQLQAAVKLSRTSADRWVETLRAERRAIGRASRRPTR